MRRWFRSHLTYANVMATLAVFLVLSGGTAVALNGSNTVFSDDIVDNEVRTADVETTALREGVSRQPTSSPVPSAPPRRRATRWAARTSMSPASWFRG